VKLDWADREDVLVGCEDRGVVDVVSEDSGVSVVDCSVAEVTFTDSCDAGLEFSDGEAADVNILAKEDAGTNSTDNGFGVMVVWTSDKGVQELTRELLSALFCCHI
jgi:hypothetical protein